MTVAWAVLAVGFVCGFLLGFLAAITVFTSAAYERWKRNNLP